MVGEEGERIVVGWEGGGWNDWGGSGRLGKEKRG